MVCPRGGFTIIRHNEVRDLLASQLTEVCGNVAVEPTLAPVSGEQFSSHSVNTADGARADIRARGFWTSHEDAFFDIRVFCPNAASYLSSSPGQLFAQHECLKRNEYVERIVNIDRGSFIVCVRGARSAYHRPQWYDVELASVEARVPPSFS